MRSVIISLAAAGLLIATPPRAQPTILPISVSLDISTILDQLGSGISWMLGRMDSEQIKAEKNSVTNLLRATVNLAGQQDALASALDNYVKNPNLARTSNPNYKESERRLNELLGDISVSFGEMKKQMLIIDPQWIISHNRTAVDVGGFASDGRVFYFTRSGMIPLSDPDQVKGMRDALRMDAQKARNLSAEISRSLANAK